MQKKLSQVSSGVDIPKMQQNLQSRAGIPGGLSADTMSAYQKATQNASKELEKMVATQIKEQEKLGKLILKRADDIKKMSDEQKKLIQGSKEELEIRERINRAENSHNQTRELYKQRDAMLNKALDIKDQQQKASSEGPGGAGSTKGPGGPRGPRGPGGSGPRTPSGFSDMLSEAGKFIGGVGKIGLQATEMYRDFSKSPTRTESSMGSAVSGSLGRQVSDIYANRTAFEQFFAPERSIASAQSLKANEATKAADKSSLLFELLAKGGAGMAGGAMFGGPLGMLVGAGIGVGSVFSNEKNRSLAMSPFSSTANKRYESILAEQLVKDYTDSYEGQKQQNPFKTMASQEYEKTFMRDLQAQRSLGLSDDGLYGAGGFFRKSLNAGFTKEMGLDMAGSVLGAGGSTRAAQNSVFGLQMSRGMGLTNAGQILGSLSGSMGSDVSTRQATIKILAEGMKLGLDDSEFAEENRKFTQMTAEIVARSGARSDSDSERVASGFSKFVGENTIAGLDAAKGAYEKYQQMSRETTGPRGVMRASAFLSDPKLSGLSTMTKQALMQVPEQDLNEDHPLVRAAAEEAGDGTTPADIVNSISKGNEKSVSRFKDSDDTVDRIRARMKDMGIERISEEDLKTLPEDVRKDFDRLATLNTAEFGYTSQKETTAMALGRINPSAARTPGTQASRETRAKDLLESDTGRTGDTVVKSMAADSKVVLDNFVELAPAMREAAKTTAEWGRVVREQNAELQAALKAARENKNAGTLKNVEDLVKKFQVPTNQQQSGKSPQ